MHILIYGHTFLQKYQAPEWEEYSLQGMIGGFLLRFKTLNVLVYIKLKKKKKKNTKKALIQQSDAELELTVALSL